MSLATKTRRRRGPREISRSAARLGAVQALYQMDIAGTAIEDVLAEYGSTRIGEAFENGECGEADVAFMQNVIAGVLKDQRLIDKTVDADLAGGWTLARLDATLRAILRAGAYELMFRDDVPAPVAISEYVNVARAFFEEGEEGAFVNGVLDTLAKARGRLPAATI